MDEVSSAGLRDLIYFDFAKAASLFSQIGGGLLKEIHQTSEETQGTKSSGGLNLPFAKAELGGDAREKTSLYESRVLHHDLLTRLEVWLREVNQILCLDEFAAEPDLSNERIRDIIGTPSFITATGYAEFQDYDRFTVFASKLNELSAFFSRATEEAIRQTPQYQEASKQIEAAKLTAESEKNPAARGEARKRVRDAEKSLKGLVAQSPSLVNEWLTNGLKLLTETMMPHRLNLRIFPYPRNPELSVIANLKRDCFVDADIENILFAYGLLPSVPLTVFGLITDMPPKEGRTFSPADELSNLTNDQRQLEQAFRRVFNSLASMEVFTRFAVYPNLTVYPIAVYQQLEMSVRAEPAT